MGMVFGGNALYDSHFVHESHNIYLIALGPARSLSTCCSTSWYVGSLTWLGMYIADWLAGWLAGWLASVICYDMI
jgi:hypothetical protein